MTDASALITCREWMVAVIHALAACRSTGVTFNVTIIIIMITRAIVINAACVAHPNATALNVPDP